MVFFTSDLHIGHKNILKYRPEFSSVKEHNLILIDKILKLTKRDILYIIGDFLFDCKEINEYLNLISNKKCRIKLILGNHDSLKLLNINWLEHQLPIFNYKQMWLSHCPIHPDEIRGRIGNVHGHLHKEYILDNNGNKDKRYFNVNIDVNNYEFVKLETIKNYFKN